MRFLESIMWAYSSKLSVQLDKIWVDSLWRLTCSGMFWHCKVPRGRMVGKKLKILEEELLENGKRYRVGVRWTAERKCYKTRRVPPRNFPLRIFFEFCFVFHELGNSEDLCVDR